MFIQIRFLCEDISSDDNFGMEIADGATVTETLMAYIDRYGAGQSLEELLCSILLVGSLPAAPDRVLQDGEVLFVIRLLAGG